MATERPLPCVRAGQAWGSCSRQRHCTACQHMPNVDGCAGDVYGGGATDSTGLHRFLNPLPKPTELRLMKLARHHRSLIIWGLYLSVFIAGLACAFCHGQMAGHQLAGADLHQHAVSQHDGHGGGHGHEYTHSVQTSHDSSLMNAATGAGCAIASLFGAVMVAALFGLVGRLPINPARPPSTPVLPTTPRYHWPPANPRASPQLLPAN